jgi:hypothetical protein
VIKVGRLKCLGQLFGMQEQNPCRKLTLYQPKPKGTRRVGRHAIKWLHSVEEDLKKVGVINWRPKVTESGPTLISHERGQGSSWTVAPVDEE